MSRLREAKLAASVYVALAINKRRKVKRKCWVKNWVRGRDQQGAYTQLISELQLEDAQQFRNFRHGMCTQYNNITAVASQVHSLCVMTSQ